MSVDEAYRIGWHEGRFHERRASECPTLRDVEEKRRADYWEGHRDGRRVREMLRSGAA